MSVQGPSSLPLRPVAAPALPAAPAARAASAPAQRRRACRELALGPAHRRGTHLLLAAGLARRAHLRTRTRFRAGIVVRRAHRAAAGREGLTPCPNLSRIGAALTGPLERPEIGPAPERARIVVRRPVQEGDQRHVEPAGQLEGHDRRLPAGRARRAAPGDGGQRGSIDLARAAGGTAQQAHRSLSNRHEHPVGPKTPWPTPRSRFSPASAAWTAAAASCCSALSSCSPSPSASLAAGRRRRPTSRLFHDLDLKEAGQVGETLGEVQHPVPARHQRHRDRGACRGRRPCPRRARQGRPADQWPPGPRAVRQAFLGHDRLHPARHVPAGAGRRAGADDRPALRRRARRGAPAPSRRERHPAPGPPGGRVGRAHAQGRHSALERDGAGHHLRGEQLASRGSRRTTWR